MKATDKIARPSGILHLSAYNEDGRLMWEMHEKNLIVNTGYTAVLEALAGVAAAAITRIGIGTNGTAPEPTDTELTAPFLLDIETIEYPTPTSVRFNFRIGYSEANGMNISEFGLITADGRLFSRRSRVTPIEKSENMSIVGQWDIHI